MATVNFDQAIICTVRRHGEHSFIIKILTAEGGLRVGYARGGNSRGQRPIWQPGNVVSGVLKSRTENQLAGISGELQNSRAPHYTEPMASEAISWICNATAWLLPEDQSYPSLYRGCCGLLDAVTLAPSARGWSEALIRYEILLFAELGFGLDLEQCAVTGEQKNLIYVSPRSGRAVSREAGHMHKEKLLKLPAFLVETGQADSQIISRQDLVDGLHLTGYFLKKYFFSERGQDILNGRSRLIERFQRALR